MHATRTSGLVVCLCFLTASPLGAQAPDGSAKLSQARPLGQLVQDALHIQVLQVEKTDPLRDIISFRKVADLKGHDPVERIQHQITSLPLVDRQSLRAWAKPVRSPSGSASTMKHRRVSVISGLRAAKTNTPLGQRINPRVGSTLPISARRKRSATM